MKNDLHPATYNKNVTRLTSLLQLNSKEKEVACWLASAGVRLFF